jgi:lysophospholipase L1-like esterase
MPSPHGDSTVRVLSLGDSYTIGEGVSEVQRWPACLAAMLRERGIDVLPPVYVAKSGWTTAELLAALDEQEPFGSFDLVTLLIGTNNQYRGRAQEEYREEFRVLLRRAIRLASEAPERVIVLSIPDWGVTPFAEGRDRARIATEIDAFNAINRDETVRAHARYVDITQASRLHPASAAGVAADGLHPSDTTCREWARLVLPAALDALTGGGVR